MATLLSIADGNFTDAATWGVCDATAELDSEAGSDNQIGTGDKDSSTFTPGVITVSGIALKLFNRAASAAGTITVTLRNSTGGVNVASVVVYIVDLPQYPNIQNGWTFFKFDTTQVLLASTAYLIRLNVSNGSQIAVYRNGTSNNWSRQLVTTTTQAPASGDKLIICGRPGVTYWGTDFAPHDLTSNTSHSPYVVSSSSNWHECPPWRAFNGNINASDTPNSLWIGQGGGGGVDWLKIDLGSGNTKTLTGYSIISGQNSFASRSPKNWTMQGSNDDSAWTTLDTITNETGWTTGEARSYFCDVTTTAYRYFRLNITQNNGDSTYTSVVEMYLWENGTPPTPTSRTVTLNNTATTSFGPTVSGGPPQGIVISAYGALHCGTAAATNYYLKWKGMLLIGRNGTLQIGSSGTPIPSDSTATLHMDCVANGDTGIACRDGTLTLYGYEKTSWLTLAADAAATVTTITLSATPTGWKSGDEVVLSGTRRTALESDLRTLTADVTTTSATLSSGLTYPHQGSYDMVAEVVNLTKNIVVRGTSATNCGWIFCGNAAVPYCRNAQFKWLGQNSNYFRGVCTQMTIGVAEFWNCAWNICNNGSHAFLQMQPDGESVVRNVVRGCVFYNNANTGTTTGNLHVRGSSTAPGNDIQDNVLINDERGFEIFIGTAGGTHSNIRASGSSGSGWGHMNRINDARGTGRYATLTITGIHVHSVSSTAGLAVYSSSSNWNSPMRNLVFDGWHIHRCGDWGMTIWNHVDNLVIKNSYFTECNYENLNIYGLTNHAVVLDYCQFGNAASYGNGARPCIGVNEGSNPTFTKITFRRCHFGASHAYYAERTGSGNNLLGGLFDNSGYGTLQIDLNDCSGFGAQILFGQSQNPSVFITSAGDSYFAVQKYNGTAGDHRRYYRTHSLQTDTVIYRTASPSERIKPYSASEKGRGSSWRIAVASGTAVTPSVYVRKSVSGDSGGANYNGAQPRLMVKANPSVGINDDAVLDTMSGAGGSWEQLSGATASPTADGVVEVYVDCDGTAGWINLDDYALL